MTISPDLQSLVEKLDALELTEGERTAFGHLLGVDPDADDVEGFEGRGVITVQGFNLFDTFPTSISAGTTRPGRGVVDHKADD